MPLLAFKSHGCQCHLFALFLTDFILPWPMVLAKYLAVRSASCDGDHHSQDCNYFCVTCLTQARRNPLECPSHGPAEPPLGMFI